MRTTLSLSLLLISLLTTCSDNDKIDVSRDFKLAIREATQDGVVTSEECNALRLQSTKEGSADKIRALGWETFLQENTPRKVDLGKIECSVETKEDISKNSSGSDSKCPTDPTMVNLLIENSYSMYGYLDKNSAFLKLMSDYVLQFDRKKQPFKLFLINDELHPVSSLPGEYANAQDIFERKRHFESYLVKNKLSRIGETRSSKLMKVLNVVTDKAVADCEPQFLVSDYIYSLAGARNMKDEMSGIQSDVSLLVGKVAEAGLATLIIKHQSSFKGRFYPFDQPRGFTYTGERPFYIWAFGNEEYLTEFVELYSVEKQAGYQSHAIFSANNDEEPLFGIFPNSANPFGTFRKSPKTANPVHALSDVSASKREGGIRFAVGLDLDAYPVTDSYRLDVHNFSIVGPDDEDWRVTEILPLKKALSDRDAKLVNTVEPTHFLMLEGEDVKSKSSELIIRFMDKKPAWLLDSHTNDDSKERIEDVIGRTFGLAYLTDGVWDAYHKRTEENKFFEFSIKLKR